MDRGEGRVALFLKFFKFLKIVKWSGGIEDFRGRRKGLVYIILKI